MESLIKTVSQWPRFIIGVILGVFFNAASPLAPLFKNPISAIAVISLFIATMVFLSLTLRAMLGLGPLPGMG
jgi:Protein of unknown function (DUF751)